MVALAWKWGQHPQSMGRWRIGHEIWHGCIVSEAPRRQIRQSNDLGHFRVVDLVSGVGALMIFRVEAREEPEGRYVLQDEGKLVASEKDIQRILSIEAIVEGQSDALVGSSDDLVVIGAIARTDQIEPIGSVRGNVDQAVRLHAGGLVSADHVEINHRPRRGWSETSMPRWRPPPASPS